MDIEKIREIMEDSQQGRIEYIDVNGIIHTGYVDVYESPYDTSDDDYKPGEAVLLFDDDNGDMTIVWESDIDSIRILGD